MDGMRISILQIVSYFMKNRRSDKSSLDTPDSLFHSNQMESMAIYSNLLKFPFARMKYSYSEFEFSGSYGGIG